MLFAYETFLVLALQLKVRLITNRKKVCERTLRPTDAIATSPSRHGSLKSLSTCVMTKVILDTCCERVRVCSFVLREADEGEPRGGLNR